MKYRVKLIFKYSDVVYIDADNEKEAIEKAMPECDEQFECFYDALVSKELGNSSEQ